MPAERDDCSELAATLAELALTHGSQEGATLDGVVKAIQADLPEFSRDDIVDSIIRYSRKNAKPTLKKMQTDLSKFQAEVKYDKSLRKQIDDLQTKIQNKDYSEPTRAAKAYDRRIEDLRFQRDRLKREINARVELFKPKSITERFLYSPFNEFRAMMTSFDLSAFARQGGFIGIAHPKLAAQSFIPMLRAFKSERVAHQIDNEIRARPNADLYRKAKLFLPDPDNIADIGTKEEVFATNFPIINFLSKHVPGFGTVVGGGIHGSARAYVTFLNKLRADTFDVLSASLAKGGTPTLEEAKTIAKFINVATGRGGLGPLERAAKGLNTVFFAPRYVTSRFQMLAEPIKAAIPGKHMFGGSRATDKLIAKEYAKYAVGIGSVLTTLSMLPGVTIEKDPRSTDFLKVKIGNTRLDMLSGLQQAAVFLAQEAAGKKSLKTGEIAHLNTGHGFKETSLFHGVDFLRKKLSPLAGAAIDLRTGTNAVGQPVTPQSELGNLVTPLLISDVAKSMQQDYGVPAKAALTLAGILGAGLNTFDETAIQAPTKSISIPPTDREENPGLPDEVKLTSEEYAALIKAHTKAIAQVDKIKATPGYAKLSQPEKRKAEKEAYDDVFKDAKETALDKVIQRLKKKE